MWRCWNTFFSIGKYHSCINIPVLPHNGLGTMACCKNVTGNFRCLVQALMAITYNHGKFNPISWDRNFRPCAGDYVDIAVTGLASPKGLITMRWSLHIYSVRYIYIIYIGIYYWFIHLLMYNIETCFCKNNYMLVMRWASLVLLFGLKWIRKYEWLCSNPLLPRMSLRTLCVISSVRIRERLWKCITWIGWKWSTVESLSNG